MPHCIVFGTAGAGKSTLINEVLLRHRADTTERAIVSDDITKNGTKSVVLIAGEFIDTPGLDSSDFSFSQVGIVSPCLVVLAIAKHVQRITLWINRFLKLLDYNCTEQKFMVVWTQCDDNTGELEMKKRRSCERDFPVLMA